MYFTQDDFDIVNSPAKYKFAVRNRRTGKTTLAVTLAFIKLLERKSVLFISPNYRMVQEVKRIFREKYSIRFYHGDIPTKFWGVELHVIDSEMRGISARSYDYVIIDEADYCNFNAIVVLREALQYEIPVFAITSFRDTAPNQPLTYFQRFFLAGMWMTDTQCFIQSGDPVYLKEATNV